MSRDDIFWCSSERNGYIANCAINIKLRMKGHITVRGTKAGQPKASCYREAFRGRQHHTEDPCIIGDGKTTGAEHTLLHPKVLWSLTVLSRPGQGRCWSSMCQPPKRKVGNDSGLSHGFCLYSPVPSTCILTRRQFKAKFINTTEFFAPPSHYSTCRTVN